MISDMDKMAQCSCGQLTAKVSGDPLRISICHCLNCQRRSGSVFAAQARFPRDQVVIAGTSTSFTLTGDEGSRAHFHFCPVCGATVYFQTEGAEETIAIPIGAFADPLFPAPTVSVYEERMHAWVVPPPGAEHIP
ncbi:GFA family protein [Massilia aurea]|nr:GFA family protein [Massilia aurea]